MAIPKRSTSGIINSVMNQPLYQQAVLNAQNVGQDKRAVGSRNATLGKLVRGERERLLGLDIKGDELAMRKDKLGFARQIAAKKHALAQDRLAMQKRSNKLALTLGGLSTVASGFSSYNSWKKDKAAATRHNDVMSLYEANNRRAMNQRISNDQTGYFGDFNL